MSGRPSWVSPRVRGTSAAIFALGVIGAACFACAAQAQERREREPNSVYADRRAKLAAQADSPIILWGFTGREESAQTYVFHQEDNFYYLTGHNEEGAGVIVLPALKNGAASDGWDGPREIFFLPAKDSAKEKWNGIRMSPSDPGIEARTGFATVCAWAFRRKSLSSCSVASAGPNDGRRLHCRQQRLPRPHSSIKSSSAWTHRYEELATA